MQALALALQIKIDAAADALRTPGRPLLQDTPDAQHHRRACNQNVEVAAEAVLQRRQFAELLHELFGIYAAL